MLNMIAGSVLPITAFIGVFFAFAATCILTSFLNDWLPRDMGREFAHNGKLSAGNQEVQGSFYFCILYRSIVVWRDVCGDVYLSCSCFC